MKLRASMVGGFAGVGLFCPLVASQFVTNGLYCGDASGYNDPRAEELKKGASDWSLLFQMDTDDELNVMWGDAGMLYFWVRREDARQLRFENTSVIQQCF